MEDIKRLTNYNVGRRYISMNGYSTQEGINLLLVNIEKYGCTKSAHYLFMHFVYDKDFTSVNNIIKKYLLYLQSVAKFFYNEKIQIIK